MTKGSENPFPYITLVDTADPATPPAGSKYLWVDTDDVLKIKDESAVVTSVTSGGAIANPLATDSLWDAAGDTVVGTGANTAAKLSLGAAGGAISRVNGAVAWNSGTSFPTAAAGDRYWRTDLGEEFYYDGTRWLSTTIYPMTLIERTAQGSGYTATSTVANAVTHAATNDIWLVSIRIAAFASAGAFDASNYWTVTLDKLDSANSSTNVSTTTMNLQTTTTWKTWLTTIGAAVTSTSLALRIVATKTASPGTLIFGMEILYRKIAT